MGIACLAVATTSLSVVGRQKFLCRDFGKRFFGRCREHRYHKIRELALRAYPDGIRAVSRAFNVPRGTVFTWVKRYGGREYEELVA